MFSIFILMSMALVYHKEGCVCFCDFRCFAINTRTTSFVVNLSLGNGLLSCGGRTRLAIPSPKRFGTIALKVEAGKPSENNNYDFIVAGIRSE